jgi:hypothetical protein
MRFRNSHNYFGLIVPIQPRGGAKSASGKVFHAYLLRIFRPERSFLLHFWLSTVSNSAVATCSKVTIPTHRRNMCGVDIGAPRANAQVRNCCASDTGL